MGLSVILSPISLIVALVFLWGWLFWKPELVHGELVRQNYSYFHINPLTGKTKKAWQGLTIPKNIVTFLLYERMPLSGTFVTVNGVLCAIHDGAEVVFDHKEATKCLSKLKNNFHWLLLFCGSALLTVGFSHNYLAYDFNTPDQNPELISLLWLISFVATVFIMRACVYLRAATLARRAGKVIANYEEEEKRKAAPSRLEVF